MIERLLFHWSPRDRREAIETDGLVPGSPSTDDPRWNPPYVCAAFTPSLAWALSGAMPRGTLVPEWDLWMTWTTRLPAAKVAQVRFGPGEDRPNAIKELRVYAAIPADDLWWVGSRPVTARR